MAIALGSVITLTGFLVICSIIGQSIADDSRARSDSPDLKIFCLYNVSSSTREGLGKLTLTDLEPAVGFCTHLVYGFAGIDPATYKVKSLNETLELDHGKGHYRQITQLKRRNPSMKVLLSVGGGADPHREAYLQILESSHARTAFINSVYNILKTYEFDGLDLAWEFPPNKPKRIHSFGEVVHKTLFGETESVLDKRAAQHKDGFTALIRELKIIFRPENYQLSFTVLPNVNSTIFCDIPNLSQNLDYIQLAAYDFQTPDRNPEEADYPAPIYGLSERNPESNVDWQVQYWIAQQAPKSKLLVCVPTHARAWKLEVDATQTGVPPVTRLKEPAPEGNQTKTPGLLSWSEVCAKFTKPINTDLKGESAHIRKVTDPTKRFGNYGYRLPDSNGEYGLWIGYEDPDSAGIKADYVVSKSLGGVCIHDIQNDDIYGTCVNGINDTGDRFPILRSIHHRISNN